MLSAEYMQSGRATEKTDVYSFGVLILEIISGKRPTDSSFIEKGLNIVGWVCSNCHLKQSPLPQFSDNFSLPLSFSLMIIYYVVISILEFKC